MVWLRDTVTAKGGRLITKRIDGDLLAEEDKLRAQYGVDAIVNATALGAAELAADAKVYPLRGALIRVVNDGSRFPQVKEALCVSHDDTQGDDAEDIVFIVPRNNNVLILGGELYIPSIALFGLTFFQV
jgi:D-amino-acid oxidase